MVVVAGAIANKSFQGGEAWVRLSWILGFKRLGFDVYLVEQIGKAHCVDERGNATTFDRSVNLAYFREVATRFGLGHAAALVYEDGDQIHGLTRGELFAIAEAAELLVNISGHLRWPSLKRRFRRTAYIDLDPGFTQFWQAAGRGGLHLEDHDFHYTIAENIGAPSCAIPVGDIQWRPTRQPVVLEQWSTSAEGSPDRFTTVANWRGSYGPVQYDGRTFGLKVHQFRRFISFPARVPQTCEIALNIHPSDDRDKDQLCRHGWQIVDPTAAAGSPEAFQRYVQTSGAEFSVAQGIYVETQSGWFSDRTVRYLASGKPVLVQDTGFSRNLPVGEGLIAFDTLDDAVVGAQEIARRYSSHCRAAREIAERYFESDRVLSRLVEETGVTP